MWDWIKWAFNSSAKPSFHPMYFPDEMDPEDDLDIPDPADLEDVEALERWLERGY